MTQKKWTDEEIDLILASLASCYESDCKKAISNLGFGYVSVRHAFRRRGLGTPMSYCRRVADDAEWTYVCAMSDLHLGSKYAKLDDINKVFEVAYNAGCRVFLCPGDFLQGHSVKGNQLWENVASGLDAQIDHAVKVLPRKEGCTWHIIAGNHDERYSHSAGASVERIIEDRFRTSGRNDLFAYSSSRAIINIDGVKVELWHPIGNKPQNSQQPLRRHVDSYPVGHEPNIVIAGHWHDAGWWEHRGIQLVACPSFQGYGGPFSASLSTGACAIGGMILSWVWKEGSFQRFRVEPVTRYDHCPHVELRIA